jgi:hypothetical protein
MFYLTNYNQITSVLELSKKINGPFKKDVLKYSFIKNELTLRVVR